jgi:hypothetical protein
MWHNRYFRLCGSGMTFSTGCSTIPFHAQVVQQSAGSCSIGIKGHSAGSVLSTTSLLHNFPQYKYLVRVCSNTLQMFFFLFCFISIHKDN